jgi:hypothetical protein
MIRLSILLNVLLLSLLACSMGSPRPRVVRDEKDKLYRPCEASEVPGDPTGRLCSRTCIKKESSKSACKEWKTTVKNFSDAKDFEFFRNGSFVFIPEQYL